ILINRKAQEERKQQSRQGAKTPRAPRRRKKEAKEGSKAIAFSAFAWLLLPLSSWRSWRLGGSVFAGSARYLRPTAKFTTLLPGLISIACVPRPSNWPDSCQAIRRTLTPAGTPSIL